jgi:spore germination cell wall hydrolase CwlJ-like protein
MSISIRSVITVLAALTASSVAPAQVQHDAEPLIAAGSGVLPVPAVIQTLEQEEFTPTVNPLDPLAPQPEVAAPNGSAEADTDAAPIRDLAALVAQYRGSEAGSRELECLAAGVYFESKSEPLAGQLAVGQVIANRAKSGRRFPSSYCGVLFQRGQFSFVRNYSYPYIPRASRQWQTAVAIAKIVDQQLHESAVPGALFFHAKRVQPRWRLTRVGSVGNHVFYR